MLSNIIHYEILVLVGIISCIILTMKYGQRHWVRTFITGLLSYTAGVVFTTICIKLVLWIIEYLQKGWL
jgi:hypothetical protein